MDMETTTTTQSGNTAAQTPLSGRKERLMASTVSISTTCGFCGRDAETPRKAYRDGTLYECCVGEAHDAHISDEEHEAFIARARAAGIDGKW